MCIRDSLQNIEAEEAQESGPAGEESMPKDEWSEEETWCMDNVQYCLLPKSVVPPLWNLSNRFSELPDSGDFEDEFPMLGGAPKCTPLGSSDVKPSPTKGACNSGGCCGGSGLVKTGAGTLGAKSARKNRKYVPLFPTVQEEKEAADLMVLLESCAADDVPLGSLAPPRPGFRLIEAVFDTGAFKSCTPPGLFPGTVRPSAMSKAGKHFSGPDQSAIPNLGEQNCRFLTETGDPASMCMQVAKIDRVLVAGAAVTSGGNTKVELLKDHGTITNMKTMKTVRLHRRGGADGGVYVMRIWIPDGTTGGFPRQVVAKK